MYKLSESIERKFIESYNIDEWEIETDTGWDDISSIHKTVEYEVWEIETENGLKISGADNHIIFDENYQELFIKNSLNKNIITKYGIDKVIKCERKNTSENMYDITVENDNHRYYTNNILSHNTEVFRIFLTHFILFNDFKTVAILANKAETSREILAKLQLSYQNLPIWLQLAVKDFNKGTFTLENNSRIIATSTSKNSARGFTAHCVGGKTKIKIKDCLNEKSKEIFIEEIIKLKNIIIKKETNTQTIYENINHRYKILTENGWNDFDGIVITHNQETIKVNIDNNELICTKEHNIKVDNNFIEAKELENIEDEIQDVYDLINVSNGNHYLTNNITSHNCVVIDEAAFIENFDEFYSAVFPVISAGEETKLIMVSTPNNLNHFYDFWQGAQAGTNGFHPIFVPWHRVPGRDEKWKKETLEGMNNDIEKFAVEFECSFIGSSSTLIAGYKLKQLVTMYRPPTIKDDNLKLNMYERPIGELVRMNDNVKEVLPAHKYFLIADVSRGKGSDYSAFSVIDCTELPYKQVCTFRDNEISPADYAEIIYKTASIYNAANVLVEINDIGEQIGYMLMMEFGYENVLCTETSSTKGKRISFGGKKADKGIRTTKFVKALGCSFLKLLIEQDKILIYDQETVNELTTFSKKKLSYEAEHGKHDDLVMGLVLFAWLTDQNYFKEVTEINTAMSFRQNNEEDINNRLTPFGFINGILGPPKKYKEYYESLNMNIPFREFVEDVEVGKTEVFDGSLWTYAEYKAKY